MGDIDDERGVGDVDEWVDPNLVIMDALSEAERQAYTDTLYGVAGVAERDVEGSDSEGVDVAVSGVGCVDRAYEDVYAPTDSVLRQLDLESLFYEATADPQAQAAYEEWSRCMGDKGYEYERPDDMYSKVFDDLQFRYDEIVGVQEGMDVFDGEEFLEQDGGEVAVGVDRDALAELQAEERDIALANFECSMDMNEQLDDVSARYEAEFIRENSAVFEGLQHWG